MRWLPASSTGYSLPYAGSPARAGEFPAVTRPPSPSVRPTRNQRLGGRSMSGVTTGFGTLADGNDSGRRPRDRAGLACGSRCLVGTRLLSLRPGLRIDPGRRARAERWIRHPVLCQAGGERAVPGGGRSGGLTGGRRPVWFRTIRRRPAAPRRRIPPPEDDVALADEAGQPRRQVRHQTAVGVDPFLDVGQVAALDDPVEPLGAADQRAGLAARQCVGDQFPRRLVQRTAVEQFDVAGGVGQQQFDGLGLAGVARGR